jgi:hypothetical protein
MVNGGQAIRRRERVDQQNVSGAVAVTGQLFSAQGSAQSPQPDTVETTQRPEQQFGGGLRVEWRAPHPDGNMPNKRPSGRMLPQGPARCRRLHGHISLVERPHNCRNQSTAAHDDGHTAIRDPVEQVSFTQQVGDQSSLARRIRCFESDEWPTPRRRNRPGIASISRIASVSRISSTSQSHRRSSTLCSGGRGSDAPHHVGGERPNGGTVPVHKRQDDGLGITPTESGGQVR